MNLDPYLDVLRRDLSAAAAPGGTEITRAADLLTGALDASARLCLLEVLSDAAAEITGKLETASVEVRLHGREADLVVTPLAAADEPTTEPPAEPPAGDATRDVARLTLRLPEPLKESVERAAAAEGVSVNQWLVRAITHALRPEAQQRTPGRPIIGRRLTGYAKA